MKKGLALKIVLSLVVAVLIVAAAAVFVVRSGAFHRFLLRQIEERAERATGAKIEIGSFTLNWEKLHADFYGITVHGTEPPSDKPLLSVQHAGLTVKVLSLLGLKFHLASLIVDHPLLHLTVDKDGRSNLPHPPASKKGGKPFSIFDFAVGHFAIHRGEIDCNDRAIPLRAELLGLHAAVDFNGQKTEYDGELSYRDGRIEFGSFSPLNHNLEAHFSATPNGIRVSPLTVSALNSRATIQATLANFNSPSVEGSYTATLSVGELARWIKSSGLPSGEVKTAGVFSYRYMQGVSPLVSVSVSGSLTSPKLTVRLPVIKAEATAASCKFDLRQGNLELRDAVAGIFGGVVSGKLSILHLNQRSQASMEASFRSVSLARAQAGLGRSELAKVAVRGLLDGEAKATWQGGLEHLRVQSRATIRQPGFALSANQGTGAIPLTGAINLNYEGGQLEFNETVLDAGHTEIRLTGVAGRNSSLSIQASSHDLRETVLLASTISKALSTVGHASIQPLGISGSGAFQGQLEGPIQDPKLTGQITASNLKYERFTVSHIQTGLMLSSSGIALHQGELAHGRALIRFNLTAGLTNWSYAPSNPIALELSIADAPLLDLEGLLAVREPLEGKLSAQLAMHGSQKNLAGDGSVRIVNAAAWGEPIQSIAAKLHGEGGVINATAILKSAAGDANGSITYNLKYEQYDGEITIPEFRLSQLAWVRQRNIHVDGKLSVSARGHGSIKSPQLAASIQSPQLRIGEETFTDFKIDAQAAQGTASIAVNSSVAGASLHAEGTVGLGRDYPADLTFSTSLVDIAPWLRVYLGVGSVKGELELSGWVKGPLKDPNQVQAHVSIPTLRLGYGTFDLANASPVSIDFKDGIFTVSPAELRGPDTEFHFQGSVPLEARGPVSATGRGDINLGILKLFFPQWDCSGRAHLDVTVEGSRSKPDFRGQMQIVNAMLEPPNLPVGIEKLNAVLALSRDRVNIQSLTAEAGGGPVSARGFISYNHGLQFNLGVTGRSVRVRYPKGVRVVLNGDLTLNGSQSSSVIGGQVLIDRLSFTQSFDLASFANELSAGSATAPSPGLAGRVNLNVAVRSGQELALNSTALSLRGSADLRVRGTLADPVVLGRASLTGGQLFFNGRRYQLQNGVVTFNNPVSTEPVMNLRVTTTVKQYTLSVNFAGPFDRMRTTYTSDPPLPPLDILNLLLTGQTAEAPSSGFGAQALLAQGLAGQVSSRVQKLAGLSSLTIDPQVGGHGTNPGARIGVQEQVTRKLFFTFSVDVTTAQDDVVQLEYQISRRLSLQAVRDQNSGYSLEIKVHKSF